jgi:SAM-dependent methyltransferase
VAEHRDIYDRAFFEEYGAANRRYAAACAFIAGELHRRFAPATAVDWGCGAGLHAAELARRGVNIVGVDAVQVDSDLAGEVDLVVADLTRPVASARIPERYDLSICIDVLEHLADEQSAAALANVTRGAELVVLSAAPPHQGGHHHVNERPRRYWVARMRELGWHYDRYETGAMERYFLDHRDRVPESWMFHNLCVYRPHPIARPPGLRRRTGGRRR